MDLPCSSIQRWTPSGLASNGSIAAASAPPPSAHLPSNPPPPCTYYLSALPHHAIHYHPNLSNYPSLLHFSRNPALLALTDPCRLCQPPSALSPPTDMPTPLLPILVAFPHPEPLPFACNSCLSRCNSQQNPCTLQTKPAPTTLFWQRAQTSTAFSSAIRPPLERNQVSTFIPDPSPTSPVPPAARTSSPESAGRPLLQCR